MMRENFKGFTKMRGISSMQVYRGTSIKMRTCPAQYRTVGKYAERLDMICAPLKLPSIKYRRRRMIRSVDS